MSAPLYVVGRVDCIALPFFVLLVAAGIVALRPPFVWLVPVVAAALAVGPIATGLSGLGGGHGLP